MNHIIENREDLDDQEESLLGAALAGIGLIVTVAAVWFLLLLVSVS